MGMALLISFHCIGYDYSAELDSLHEHLRDVQCEDIFKLSTSVAASEFCEGLDGMAVYIPHKYQAKPDSFPWFLAACAAAIIQRNDVFCLHQQNKSWV